MMIEEVKKQLVKMTAARFHKFIESSNAQMEDLIEHAESGRVNKQDECELVALSCVQEFVAQGSADVMRKVRAKAAELHARASVEFLGMTDTMEIAAELADMLEEFNNERANLDKFHERIEAAVKKRAELN